MTGKLLRPVAEYYEGKLAQHGLTAAGVDWNGAESQNLRFSKLCEVLPERGPYTVLDFGCGYGGLLDYLKMDHPAMGAYVGYDISERMIEAAREQHGGNPRARFVAGSDEIPTCDFAVASGVFNVRLQATTAEWERYILESIDRLDSLSTRGFSFNLLSLYSDAEKRRDYLHYADSKALFDYCMRKHPRRVRLLHDYPLYEFTILVRKDS